MKTLFVFLLLAILFSFQTSSKALVHTTKDIINHKNINEWSSWETLEYPNKYTIERCISVRWKYNRDGLGDSKYYDIEVRNNSVDHRILGLDLAFDCNQSYDGGLDYLNKTHKYINYAIQPREIESFEIECDSYPKNFNVKDIFRFTKDE